MSELQRRARREAQGGPQAAADGVPPHRTPYQQQSKGAVSLRTELTALFGLTCIVALIILYLHLPSQSAHADGSSRRVASDGQRLFTPEELRPYDGQHSRKIYLAILGDVYDVTPGARHYGKGGGYSFFAARDASRAYVTGDFQHDRNDDVMDFTADQFQGLVKWHEFFRDHKEYRLVGHVVGRFYDADGHSTPLLGRALELARQENEAMARRREERQQREQQGGASLANYTPCNVRWTKAEGGAVWCTDGQFPRQVAVPGRDGELSMRCACFGEDRVDASRRLYPGCAQRSDTCATSPPE